MNGVPPAPTLLRLQTKASAAHVGILCCVEVLQSTAPRATDYLRGEGPLEISFFKPLLKQGQLKQVLQDQAQSGFEYLHGRRPYSLSGQPLPALTRQGVTRDLISVQIPFFFMVNY